MSVALPLGLPCTVIRSNVSSVPTRLILWCFNLYFAWTRKISVYLFCYRTMECQIRNINYVKWAIENVTDNNIVVLRDVMSGYFRNIRSAKLRNNLRFDQEAHLSVFKMHTFKYVCFCLKTDVVSVTYICYPALPKLSSSSALHFFILRPWKHKFNKKKFKNWFLSHSKIFFSIKMYEGLWK